MIRPSKLILLSTFTCALFASGEYSNRRAPGFSMPDTGMKQHDIADYKGKVVLIEFMSTGCPRCQKVTPALEKTKAKYKDQVVILSVVNPPDNMTTVTQYIRQYKVTSPILFDCGQMTASYLKISPSNPTVHFPHLFIIDQNGYIKNDFGDAAVSDAFLQGPPLYAEIDKLLGGGKK